MKPIAPRGTAVNTVLRATMLAVPAAVLLLSACSPDKPAPQALRPVRTAELRYDGVRESNRYTATVQARHEIEHAFRVGGKVAARKVDVGQTVREGDVMAILDDHDYRLADEASREDLVASTTQAKQADSDRRRLEALKGDGSVSVSDDENAQTRARTTQAAADAAARKSELARNRVNYTVLRASRSGVVTAVRFEVGQVVAEGQAIVAIADPGEAEIVVDVPEDQLASFKLASFKASLASAPEQTFDVSLRELAPQAVAQTRTFRARLKPAVARTLPLGATATLVAERKPDGNAFAAIPSAAITQKDGQPAVWVVQRAASEPAGTVNLMRVAVQAYRNEEALVSGPRAGELVVTAGVQKMAPGLRVALPDLSSVKAMQQASR
jgi:RND family efflux transporter MFP subunit